MSNMASGRQNAPRKPADADLAEATAAAASMMAGTAADFGPSQCGLSMSSTKDGPPHGAGKDRTAAELSPRGGSAGKGFASPKNRDDACPGASEATENGRAQG